MAIGQAQMEALNGMCRGAAEAQLGGRLALLEGGGAEFACIVADEQHDLIPVAANISGLLILGVYGLITEVMAGGTEDQGVVTVYDGDDNALGTLTPLDAGADAIGDTVLSTVPEVFAAATGTAVKHLAAGKKIYGKVTQACSGAGLAGKMKVVVVAVPLQA